MNGKLPVNRWVFGHHFRLVEVVHMLNVRSAKATIENEWGVRSDEHGDGSSAASWSSVAAGVHGNVAADGNSVAAVPVRRLYPCNAVEEGSGAAVAGVCRVNAFDVCVPALFKQLQKFVVISFHLRVIGRRYFSVQNN